MIIAVANQKGGAAKTTTAAHVAWAAQEKGLRVLVVDLDKQGNMSYLFKGDDAPVNNLKASQLFFRAREARTSTTIFGSFFFSFSSFFFLIC